MQQITLAVVRNNIWTEKNKGKKPTPKKAS